jgi:bifunctional N-acetylglucosamine-1-phosphate-uridyltransferase/glucosamine-1-phosphate-acetyltransferase GlmU-like protein
MTAISPDLTTVTLGEFVSSRGAPFPVDPAEFAGPTDAGTPLTADALAAFHAAVTARNVVCVVLAAGQGSRFVAPFPKVIHPFAGVPLAQHSINAAAAAGIPAVVIVGYARDEVCAALSAGGTSLAFIVQEEQMGTGHAVYLAKFALPVGFDGDIIILYADNPGVDQSLVEQLLSEHAAFKRRYGGKYGAMVLTGSRASAGYGADAYGRMVRATKNDGGPVVDIVEKKTIMHMTDAGATKKYDDSAVLWTGPELDALDEFNSGIVVARGNVYMDVLASIVANNTKLVPPKYEYYATDFVKAMVVRDFIAEGWAVPINGQWKLEGANTLNELMELEGKQAARRNVKKTATARGEDVDKPVEVVVAAAAAGETEDVAEKRSHSSHSAFKQEPETKKRLVADTE